jgi:hypothetical protein
VCVAHDRSATPGSLALLSLMILMDTPPNFLTALWHGSSQVPGLTGPVAASPQPEPIESERKAERHRG